MVATPIGNLRDITLRALDVLAAAQLVCCEDTRQTQKLLAHYGIKAATERCDAHTETKRAAELASRIAEGAIIAFASDAGTPGISDPGSRLAAAIRLAGHPVFAIPGPSAAIAAISAAGLDHGRFLFCGFLPVKSAARRQELQQLSGQDAILVLYEAPQRVPALLEDIDAMLGPRQVVIARELTKLHEEFISGTSQQVAAAIALSELKGEVVVLIAPGAAQSAWHDEAVDDALRNVLNNHPLKEAVAMVTAQSGLPRKTVYARALAIKGA